MNLVLTRQLAIIQARLEILDGFSDALTELSDMKELRKLRVEVQEYLQIQRAKETIPPNPAEYVSGEVRQIEQALQEANSIHADCMSFASELFKPNKIQITADELDSLATQLEKKCRLLPKELEQLRNRFSQDQWQKYGDVENSILFFAKLRCPQSTIQNDSRKEWHLFALSKGLLWSELKEHLHKVEMILAHMQRDHATANVHYKSALLLANAGNYIQAQSTLDAAPNRVIDEDFKAAQAKITEWQQVYDSFTKTPLHDTWAKLMAEPIGWGPVLLAQRRRDRLSVINSLDQWAETQLAGIAHYPSCDFRQNVEDLLRVEKEKLNQSRSDVFLQTRKRWFQLSGIGVCALILFVVMPYALARYHTMFRIETNPSGASVSLDGIVVGEAPVTLRVNPGAHKISLALPECEPLSLPVYAKLAQRTNLVVQLTLDPVFRQRLSERFQEFKAITQLYGDFIGRSRSEPYDDKWRKEFEKSCDDYIRLSNALNDLCPPTGGIEKLRPYLEGISKHLSLIGAKGKEAMRGGCTLNEAIRDMSGHLAECIPLVDQLSAEPVLSARP